MCISKDHAESKYLCHKDTNSDQQLGHDTNTASKIFGGHLTEVHWDNIGAQTCGIRSNLDMEMLFVQFPHQDNPCPYALRDSLARGNHLSFWSIYYMNSFIWVGAMNTTFSPTPAEMYGQQERPLVITAYCHIEKACHDNPLNSKYSFLSYTSICHTFLTSTDADYQTTRNDDFKRFGQDTGSH